MKALETWVCALEEDLRRTGELWWSPSLIIVDDSGEEELRSLQSAQY